MSDSSLTEQARERGQVIVWLDDVQTALLIDVQDCHAGNVVEPETSVTAA
jgi:hypothetical protein